MSVDINGLRLRFDRAAAAAGAVRTSGSTFDELVARHAEPHRRYHTLAHVEACLAWLDRVCHRAAHPEEVELALFFHDAIYASGRKYNERRSADLARERLGQLGIGSAAIERLAGYVEATQHHAEANGDAALVVDIDLTILGAAPEVFARFEEQIRQEYAHVPGPLFQLGRRRVLKGFLAKPVIYDTPEIRARLEDQARANLECRVASLRWTRFTTGP